MHSRIQRVRSAAAFLWGIAVVAVCTGAASAAPPDPFTHLYDTGTTATGEIDRSTWTEVAEDNTGHAFQGDAVLENDKITAVLRKGSAGAELFSRNGTVLVKQALLAPTGGVSGGAIQSVTILKNAPDGILVEAAFQSADAAPETLQFELLVGQAFLRAGATGAIKALRVEAPTDFVVLPDFFADDIVIAASDLPAGIAELPSENFLLNLTGGGNAIVMNVWDNRDQDIRVISGSSGGVQSIQSTEITFGEGGNVWVAVLAEPGIWHVRDIAPADSDKVLPLEWNPPYPAVWRVDWRRTDGLTDSWEMAIEKPDGRFSKSEIFEVSKDAWTDQDWWNERRPRRRWNTVLGGYMYPCWIDRSGRGFLQPLEHRKLAFAGPAVIYPLSRGKETPLEKFSIADVVRATLGVGPCQYILDVEGQDMAFKGRPTCDVRDTLNDIYGRGQQSSRTADVKQALDDVQAFIHMIRGRIEQYAAFGREMKAYLVAQHEPGSDPDPVVLELLQPIQQLDEAIEARREGIKTTEYADRLADEFRNTLIDYKGPDPLGHCQEYTEKWVGIGENQDELVAECRLAVRLLRQRAALALAKHPESTALVNEVRERTREILRDPVNYEAARH